MTDHILWACLLPLLIPAGLLMLAHSKNKSVKNTLYYMAVVITVSVMLGFVLQLPRLLLAAAGYLRYE